jgi:septin family protein
MEPTQDIREKFGRFRILVMGRANAGKTTLLQRICNTTEKPEIFDRKGNKVDLAFHATSVSPTDQWQSDRCRYCAGHRQCMYARILGTDLDNS